MFETYMKKTGTQLRTEEIKLRDIMRLEITKPKNLIIPQIQIMHNRKKSKFFF